MTKSTTEADAAAKRSLTARFRRKNAEAAPEGVPEAPAGNGKAKGNSASASVLDEMVPGRTVLAGLDALDVATGKPKRSRRKSPAKLSPERLALLERPARQSLLVEQAECTRCKAPKGSDCHKAAGKRRRPHADRQRAYLYLAA